MSSEKSARIVALLLIGGALALPDSAHANLWHKISKAAKSTTHAVEKTAHKAGDTVHDSGITIGKEVRKGGDTATRELIDNGKVVGHVVIKDGKVVATETVEGGKVVASEAETGAKFIVKGEEIVGREVLVDGKVVGQEVIKDGKVVGHTVVEGGEYIVQAGMILYDAMRNCKKLGGMIPMPNLGAKDASAGAQCSGQATVGFTCKIPHLLDDFAKIPALLSKIEKEGESSECQKATIPPLPQICGVGKLLADDAQKVFACAVAAEKAGIVKEFMPGKSRAFPSEEACMADGELAFDAAKSAALAGANQQLTAAMKDETNAAGPSTATKVAYYLLKTYKAVGMLGTVNDISAKLKQIPACAN